MTYLQTYANKLVGISKLLNAPGPRHIQMLSQSFPGKVCSLARFEDHTGVPKPNQNAAREGFHLPH